MDVMAYEQSQAMRGKDYLFSFCGPPSYVQDKENFHPNCPIATKSKPKFVKQQDPAHLKIQSSPQAAFEYKLVNVLQNMKEKTKIQENKALQIYRANRVNSRDSSASSKRSLDKSGSLKMKTQERSQSPNQDSFIRAHSKNYYSDYLQQQLDSKLLRESQSKVLSKAPLGFLWKLKSQSEAHSIEQSSREVPQKNNECNLSHLIDTWSSSLKKPAEAVAPSTSRLSKLIENNQVQKVSAFSFVAQTNISKSLKDDVVKPRVSTKTQKTGLLASKARRDVGQKLSHHSSVQHNLAESLSRGHSNHSTGRDRISASPKVLCSRALVSRLTEVTTESRDHTLYLTARSSETNFSKKVTSKQEPQQLSSRTTERIMITSKDDRGTKKISIKPKDSKKTDQKTIPIKTVQDREVGESPHSLNDRLRANNSNKTTGDATQVASSQHSDTALLRNLETLRKYMVRVRCRRSCKCLEK